MSKLVQRVETDPENTTTLWRIASHQAAQVGDRVYLFKQGNDPRGIFGIGEIVEPPRLQIDPADIDEGQRFRVKIKFDRLVDPAQGFLLSYEEIQGVVPDTLITAQASGNGIPGDVASELETRLASFLTGLLVLASEQADTSNFDPDSANDQRQRALRAIRIRRGQPAFRAALLKAYGGRCAITGCTVEDVLEAAHITPYLGDLTNHVSNGLLLRADLHTLFDCGLIAIEPKTRTVIVASSLQGSSYAKMAGKTLRPPKTSESSPSRRNLEKRLEQFKNVSWLVNN